MFLRALFAFSLLAVTASAAPHHTSRNAAPFDTAMRRLMTPAGFRPPDFDLLVNYRTGIPRTLPVVSLLLRRPQAVDSLVPALRASIQAALSETEIAPSSSGPASLWHWIDVDQVTNRTLVPGKDEILVAEDLLARYLKPLSKEAVGFLRRELPELLVYRAEDTSLGPVESEVERLRADVVLDSVMKLADSLPLESLAEAAQALDRARRKILESARNDGVAITIERLRGLRARGTPVVIGSPGDDVHRLDRGIVFETGGDDRYEFPDSARPGSWLMVIDLSGDDEYVARDTIGGAAAFLSIQILHDVRGDDRYAGKDLAFGSAVLGYSHLIDEGGDDRYEARCASLGFAYYGVGILEDHAGDDVYSTGYFSQGASSTRGLGVLVDRAGNDRYLSRPEFPDDLRYRDHFLSLSQGFSSGFSPRYAGGIGVLWDQAGDDAYTADIFGQGTGYWFGWGVLLDDAGADTLRAYQYAQGAGVHFAAGTVWDKAGNDVRVSKGVSQGCGHDGGFGLLVDEQGDDHTTAVDMSAGAGSANGLGVFVDLAGNDRYSMGNPKMTLGHGDLRRDRGSFGFFLDLGGRDTYPVADSSATKEKFPGENSVWRVYDSKLRGYGMGLDAD